MGRRQEASLFTFSADIDFNPSAAGEEAGVSVFLAQHAHLELGLTLLPSKQRTGSFPGYNTTETNPEALIPQIRFRGEGELEVPKTAVLPLPEELQNQKLHFEIKAANWTHYAFSVGPVDAMHKMQTIGYGANSAVSGGYTGKYDLSISEYADFDKQLQGLSLGCTVHQMGGRERHLHMFRIGSMSRKARLDRDGF